MSTISTVAAAPTAANPNAATKPADPIGPAQSPFPIPNSQFPLPKSKSLRPLFENLASAGTHLDSILEDLELSPDEAQSLLASQKFRTHRQLRTELISQQLQLAAQDHAHHAMQRLLDLSNSHHPAVARLAATQILAYAGLTPQTPDKPSFLNHLPAPTQTPPQSPPQSPPTEPPQPAPSQLPNANFQIPTSNVPPSPTKNPFHFPLPAPS